MSEKKEIKIQTESENEEEKAVSGNNSTSSADAAQKFESGLDRKIESDAEPKVEDPLGDLEDRLKATEQEARENYDRLLRVSAEFENYKKRASREMEEFRKYSNQSLIKELLSVVDNLELAMSSTSGHEAIDQGLLQGLEMTHREILKVFEKFAVKPISASGEPFDPTYHEAVMQEETDEVPENTVVNEMQKGYLIHDRLLRPSMVVVAKSKTKKNDADPQTNAD
ncbi:MAG: nucleotide exchange factor GrpE [Desulfobacterales bacterium]|nr:nucleotide exchange factor GrpE [Desulfobacterales bacterium]